MLCFELVTLAALYGAARLFTDKPTALLVPLLYVSAGYVMQHGFSFRIDPMLTAGLATAICILLRSRLTACGIIGFGACAAFAAIVSIKAVLYAPAFAGIMAYRLMSAENRRDEATRLAVAIGSAIAIWAVLYFWHSQFVTAQEGALTRGNAVVQSSASYLFFLGIPPYWFMILRAFIMAPLLAGLLLVTPFFLYKAQVPLATKVLFAGLWLPLLCVLFYVNTAGYFYVFLFAPLALSVILPLSRISRRFSPMLVAIALGSVAVGIFMLEDSSTIDRQRKLEVNVREVFEEPVAYFDHNFMLAGWPKANGFMTPWGMQRYRDAGIPTYRQAMEREPVPLLLANWWTIRAMLEAGDDTLLLPEDNEALRNNYIAFSWPIWIAGKDYTSRLEPFRDEFLVPGDYTVEVASVSVDGQVYEIGDVIRLERGLHDIAFPARSGGRLVWGDRLQRPAEPLEPGPLYVGF